jgi:hypothetical protein
MMGWLRKTFGRGEQPVERVEDPVLGTLVWSKDDEGWVGQLGGLRIVVCDSIRAVPSPQVLDYARTVLGPQGDLFRKALAEAKAAYRETYRLAAEEFDRLEPGTLSFEIAQRGPVCFVELIGGNPDRFWRVEFTGTNCDGFGFDT